MNFDLICVLVFTMKSVFVISGVISGARTRSSIGRSTRNWRHFHPSLRRPSVVHSSSVRRPTVHRDATKAMKNHFLLVSLAIWLAKNSQDGKKLLRQKNSFSLIVSTNVERRKRAKNEIPAQKEARKETKVGTQNPWRQPTNNNNGAGNLRIFIEQIRCVDESKWDQPSEETKTELEQRE